MDLKVHYYYRLPLPKISKQTLKIMKLIAVILFAACTQVSARGYSQITLSEDNTPLQKVFKEIQKQSGYDFVCTYEILQEAGNVSVNVRDVSLQKALEECLKGKPLTYVIIGKTVVVQSKEKDYYNITNVVVPEPLPPPPIEIHGRVVNQQGEPLQNVSVLIAGTQIGTTTNADGRFTLTAPDDRNIVLEISSVGYQTKTVNVGNQSEINVILEKDIAGLGEVVVVGYGTEKRKDLTGSIVSINADKLLDKPAFNVAQAISGKVAGVKIIEQSGAPGEGVMIRIRGTNSINSGNDPLFVVDGIVGVANALTILNPNEIQSIDVLKDASATAIYGARGSNGVIIITTKRGKAGKTQVEYDGYITRGVISKRMPLANADEAMYTFKQAWLNVKKYGSPIWSASNDASILPASVLSAAGTVTYSELPHLFEQIKPSDYFIPLLGKDGNYYKPRFNTNWEDLTFNPSTSFSNEFSIRGGSDKAKFGAFFSYALQDGLARNSFINRFTGKFNSDIKVTDWFDISSSLGINKSVNAVGNNGFFGALSRTVVEAFSFLPVKYPNDPAIYGARAGAWSINADLPIGEYVVNPVYSSTESEAYTKRDQVTGYVTLNFKIIPSLSFKSNFSIDGNFNKYNAYGSIGLTNRSRGSATINTSNSFYWQNENYFNYNKTFGHHYITGLLGLSWSRNQFENLNTNNSIFFDDFYGWHNIGIGSAIRPVPQSNDGKYSLNSYFARATYSYKGKYLATVTGRIDGSSKFGTNSKYGFFPSGSLAWRISEEKFAKNLTALSDLKLRLGVGQTGNQEIGSYVTQTFIGSDNIIMGGAVENGLFASSMGNDNLKWEKTTEYNAGLDLSLFKGRITMAVDLYYKLTTDMLLDVPLPESTTIGTVKENYGSVENKGFEVGISTENIKGKNFNWSTDLAFSMNKNKIVKLGTTGADIYRNNWIGGPATILRVGEPIGTFFGLTRLGTYSTKEVSLAAKYNLQTGDIKYRDTNGDGKIDFMSDAGIIGSAFPLFDLDIINSLDYKNFDFNIDIRISYGAKKMNYTSHTGENLNARSGNKQDVINAWRPDHQNTMVAQLRPTSGGGYRQAYPDTYWLEDASFVRGEGATLGYTFSRFKKFGPEKLRVYANTRNFFCLNKYSGYDPEGNDPGNNDSLTPGIDFYMYPRSTTYTFGVNLIF